MIAWARKPLVWRGLAGLLVAVCVLVGYQGLSNLLQAKAQLNQLRSANQQLAQDNRDLYRTVVRLRSDAGAVERACRRDMGMVRPDEVVYQAATPAAKPN